MQAKRNKWTRSYLEGETAVFFDFFLTPLGGNGDSARGARVWFMEWCASEGLVDVTTYVKLRVFCADVLRLVFTAAVSPTNQERIDTPITSAAESRDAKKNGVLTKHRKRPKKSTGERQGAIELIEEEDDDGDVVAPGKRRRQ